MQQMLYIGVSPDTSCAMRAFEMFWIGPAIGMGMWIVYVILTLKGPVPYLWLLPIVVGLFFGIALALSRSTTNVYLEGGEIVQNSCYVGQAEQERAPISSTRSTVQFVGKHKNPILDIYWPKQPFALKIPLDSGDYLANVRNFAPVEIDAYVEDMLAKGKTLPRGLQ